MSDPLVLVTGAAGYIATHIVQQLLKAGYRVRGTARSLKDEKKVKLLMELCPGSKHKLQLVEADLLNPDSWPSAVKDCTYVLHVASPFPAADPRDENEVIKPAVDGTLNVLRACHDAKVKRVVLTSSIASVSAGYYIGGEKTYSEEDWTDTKNPDLTVYIKSKTLAEKAAWDYWASLADGDKFEFVVINPAYVMGPVLCGEFSTSMLLIKRFMERDMPVVPKCNYVLSDVREVAAAHLAAMTSAEAVGHRHLISAGNLWCKEIAQILSKEFKGQGYNPAVCEAPYFMLWLAGRLDDVAKSLLPQHGKVTLVTNNRMLNVLKVQPRPLTDTILDMAYSMIEGGEVKKTRKYKPRQVPAAGSK